MTTQHESENVHVPMPVFAVGVIALAVAAVTSVLMVMQHLAGLELAGCGPESDCAKATSSVWGSIPGLGTPTSIVGAAFFIGMFVAWVTSKRQPSGTVRMFIRLGAVLSVFFVVVMISGGYLCKYCLIIHVSNLVFWLLVEFGSAGAHSPSLKPAAIGGVVSLVAFCGLVTADLVMRGQADEKAEGNLERATQQIIEGSQGNDFTGRWRLGPEKAAIRVVVFSDYQCPDCKRHEHKIMKAFAERDDMSVSMKHFPFCSDCNPYMKDTLHPNACWAARAAETAGILGGEEAFWEMHRWLFEIDGNFTNAALQAKVVDLGLDVQQWNATMPSAETLRRVQDDVGEAVGLGIRRTPFIFINGVLLEGWERIEDAFERAITALAATNPPARTAAADKPPTAIPQAIAKWQASPVLRIAPDSASYPMGNTNGSMTVVVWGDYEEPYTKQADGIIRAFAERDGNVRYEFRHYPINATCNPQTTNLKHPNACRMAQAAEAAGILRGAEGYAIMHAWLFENQETFSEARLAAAVEQLGFDRDAFFRTMQSSQAADGIAADAAAGKGTGLTAVPWIIVNGKHIESWLHGNLEAITPILDRARGGGGG